MVESLFFILICSLGMNVYPALNIAAVLAFGPFYLLAGRHHRNPCPSADPRRWLWAAYCYWIVSYFLTTGSLTNFFSFDFLRRDGAIFFAYLPLLLICEYGLQPERIRELLNMYLSIMGVLAVIGAVQFAAVSGIIPDFVSFLPDSLVMVRQAGASGLEFHALIDAHNAAGGAYAIASLMALAMLLFSGTKPRILSWPTLWFSLALVGLALTKSRGAYLAFCAAALLVFFHKKDDFKRAVKPLFLVVLPLFYFLVQQAEVATRVNAISAGDSDPNVIDRFELWSRAVGFIASSPLFGIGFGRFNDDNLQFYGIPHFLYLAFGGKINNDNSHAHNSFLHFAAEGGLVGLALMLGIWLAVYRWAKWSESQFPEGMFPFALARGIRACVLLECFLSFTEHMMNSAVTTVTIFALFGLLRNAVQQRDRWLLLQARLLTRARKSMMGNVLDAHT